MNQICEKCYFVTECKYELNPADCKKRRTLSSHAVLAEVRAFLESSRKKHHYCDDSWYSCPRHEDGCANDDLIDCNCGADKYNMELDIILKKLSEHFG